MLSYQMSDVLTKEETKQLIYAKPAVYQKRSLEERQQLSAIRILLYEQSNYQIYINAKLIKQEINKHNDTQHATKEEAIVYTWEVQWEKEGKQAVKKRFKTKKAVLDAIDAYLTKKTKKKAAHDKSFGVTVWNYFFGKKAAKKDVEPKKAAKKVNKKAVNPKKAVKPLNLKF